MDKMTSSNYESTKFFKATIKSNGSEEVQKMESQEKKLKANDANNQDISNNNNEMLNMKNLASLKIAEVANLQRELEIKSGEIQSLKVQNDNLKSEITRVFNSKSWRLTSPLRAITTFAINYKDKFSRLIQKRPASFALIDEVKNRRVSLLADSAFLDVPFVGKQLNQVISNSRQAAQAYYDAISQNIRVQPNPLFEDNFYSWTNKLSRNDDPVEHYLTIGAAAHLPVSPNFDINWYIEQLPEAKDAPDLIVHYFEVGYFKNITPINLNDKSVPNISQKIFFAEANSLNAALFDYELYSMMYEDMRTMSPAFAEQHFVEIGIKEGRIGTIEGLLKSTKCLGRFLPFVFDPMDYYDVHLDLQSAIGVEPMRLLQHYLEFGIGERRAPSLDALFGLFKPTNRHFSDASLDELEDKMPLCVVLHMFYIDLWEELQSYLKNIPIKYDLYVNLVESSWDFEVIEKIRKFKPDANILISENKGRDMGGFWRLMDVINFKNYTAFAMLHSKKSPHVSSRFVEVWKADLLNAILESEERVRQNIAAFLEDDKIGIIGSARRRDTGIGSNIENYNNVLDYYKIKPENRECEYVSGTMMMVRSDIMEAIYTPLKDAEWEDVENASLAFHMDGQLAHSIERLFGNLTKQMGYEILWR